MVDTIDIIILQTSYMVEKTTYFSGIPACLVMATVVKYNNSIISSNASVHKLILLLYGKLLR